MFASFLITFREVIEASLIVATVLGILTRLDQTKGVRTVWLATMSATLASVALLGAGSIFGLKMQEMYSGKTEEFIEGILMIMSAAFITWAVFFLHTYFAQYKTRLLVTLQNRVNATEQTGLFWLTFTAVFREGFEIVLFLSTIYFSSNPWAILTGFTGGLVGGLLVSLGLFASALKLPVRIAFRVTSGLLILFAGGLAARGIHEFTEAGILPEFANIHLFFLPQHSTFAGDMVKTIFGLTRSMDIVQVGIYAGYVTCMTWWVFFRKEKTAKEVAD